MTNNNQPLVSVLMTVYNREQYISEAIESVINSTYQNWELIIVDDQSKDNSVAIAKTFENEDSRIRVYINDKNLGDYPNRNKAASYAKGKYLKYVDADDMIYSYGLEQLVCYMEQFPDAGYGLCSLSQDKNQIFPFQLSPNAAYRRHYIDKLSLFHKAPLSAIIKTSAFKVLNGFTGKQHLGDFELWHLLSQKFPVVLMPHGIVWYREHDDQQMNDNRTNPFVPFKYLLIAEQLLNSSECPIKDKNKVLEDLKKKKAKVILSSVKHHSIKKGLELKRASGMSFWELLKSKL